MPNLLAKAVKGTVGVTGKAVGKTVGGATKATKKLSKTVSKAAEKGENLVIGKPPGRTSSHSSRGERGVGRHSSGRGKPRPTRSTSGKGSSSKRRERSRCRAEEGSDEVHMFCSDMYTHEFVVDAAKQVEQDTNVTSLVLEDLVQRNCNETTQVIVDLLADNFFSNNKKGGKNNSQRIWTAITFIDCISDVDTYTNYLDVKTQFVANMKRRLAMKGMTKDLPIRFEAKIELHTMLDVYGVIQLLQAIERDNSIKSIKFPGFRGEDKDVVEAFSGFADTETMEWKETVEILVRYRRTPPKDEDKANPATAVLGDLAKKLQMAVFAGGASTLSLGDSANFETSAAFDPVKPGMRDESATEVSLFDSDASLRVRPVSP